jgi:hypothetical protein
MERPEHPLKGNQFALKTEGQKVTGKGRLNVDLGTDLKKRLINASEGGKLKKTLLEILEEGLEKRGY